MEDVAVVGSKQTMHALDAQTTVTVHNFRR